MTTSVKYFGISPILATPQCGSIYKLCRLAEFAAQPRMIEIIFGGASPRQKYLSRRERALTSAHTGKSALNAAPAPSALAGGLLARKQLRGSRPVKIKKAPTTSKGHWDRNKPAVPPKLAVRPLCPRHHAAGAVTGALPGVSFAPLASPFTGPSAAALTAYAQLSVDFVYRVLFSVIGLMG